MDAETTAHPTSQFLDELLTFYATIDDQLASMRDYQLATGKQPDDNASRLILRDLLAGIFEGRDPQPEAALLEQTTALVAWATRSMCDELFFVPPAPEQLGRSRQAKNAAARLRRRADESVRRLRERDAQDLPPTGW